MKLFDWLIWEKISISDIRIIDPKNELKTFVSYAVFYILVVFIFSFIIKIYPLPLFQNVKFTDDLWYIVFVKIIFLLIVPLSIYKHQGYSFSSLFTLCEVSPFPILFSFFCGSVLNFSHISKIVPLLGWPNFLKIFIGILLPLIAAAIPEEIFYRRILQTRIEKTGGWFLSIIGSSFLFSLFHFPSRYLLSTGVEGTAGNLPAIFYGTLLPVFIIGIVFGFLWNRYRNIFLLIALHYGIDLLPSLSSVLGVMK